MQPILWTKGLMLTPQHLQTQDRFLEDVLEFRLSSHAFCPWGFRALEVDREALAQGAFAISSAEGVFPDGLLFSIPDSDPPPAPKTLDDYWGEDRESIQVHLALPERRLGGLNVSVDRENGSTRFLAEAVLRRDENTGASERPIQIARKNLRLLTEVENLDGFSVLPVAKVARAPTGEYRLDAAFVPPAVDISANEHLMAIARRLVELLSAKSSGLSGMRREMRKGLADFGISDVANFWLLYTVNSHLAYLRHLYETRKGHPGVLYEAMLALAGALTTFSTTIRPTDLPPYDHGDLTACFTRLDEALRELLETVVPESHATLPLKTTEEPSIYATRLDQERYLRGPEMYLAISADVKLEELIADVPRLVKVSSGDRVDKLVHQAIEGLGLRYVPDPPRSLPVKLDYRYFRLDRSGADWDAVRMARSLAAYVPTRFPSPRLELVILLPPEE
jgi:type VI secretion system protein ImpJ